MHFQEMDDVSRGNALRGLSIRVMDCVPDRNKFCAVLRDDLSRRLKGLKLFEEERLEYVQNLLSEGLSAILKLPSQKIDVSRGIGK